MSQGRLQLPVKRLTWVVTLAVLTLLLRVLRFDAGSVSFDASTEKISSGLLFSNESSDFLNESSDPIGLFSAQDRDQDQDSTAAGKKCRETSKPKPFDSFLDLRFEEEADQSKGREGATSPSYSSVHCVGTGSREPQLQSDADSYKSRRPNFVSRSCRYRNIYYKLADQSFHYYASPIESAARKEALAAGDASASELNSRIEVSMGHATDQYLAEQLVRKHIKPWKPVMHKSDDNWLRGATVKIAKIEKTANTSSARKAPVFLLYQPYHSKNFGHFILDDLLSLFSLLDLFDMLNDSDNDNDNNAAQIQAIPFFVELHNTEQGVNYGGNDRQWRCSPANQAKWLLCAKLYRKFYPELFGMQTDTCSGDIMRTGNWLQGQDRIGVWYSHPKEVCQNYSATTAPRTNTVEADYILMPQVLVGTGRLSQHGCQGDCSVSRGPQLYRFRSHLLGHIFGPTRACQIKESIPAGYITFSLPIDSSRLDQVYFFEKEIEWAKAKYGEEQVRVVDMASITIQEQADIVLNSAVLLTNHGGGGVVSLFLSRGSGVLVFWNDSYRFDHNFYESTGHFRTTWVSFEERNHTNMTIARIEQEVELTSTEWSGVI